ncbi:hypothetical protein [Pseudofrankia asymbiotica]|uniref:hypothetical protein n=1 Tax=Pseudofrankia asymbiotica TaxID=1834516 RepID=UPI0010556AAF|nr:hypothetical protein [Pseudofrankia asymbiotica]
MPLDQLGPGPVDRADREADDRLEATEEAAGIDGAAAGAERDKATGRGEAVHAVLHEIAAHRLLLYQQNCHRTDNRI